MWEGSRTRIRVQGIALWCRNATHYLLFEGHHGAIFSLLPLDLDPVWFVRNNKGQNQFHHNQKVLRKQKHNTINEGHPAPRFYSLTDECKQVKSNVRGVCTAVCSAVCVTQLGGFISMVLSEGQVVLSLSSL